MDEIKRNSVEEIYKVSSWGECLKHDTTPVSEQPLDLLQLPQNTIVMVSLFCRINHTTGD